MRVFGIDPGSVRTGWGVIERQGSRLLGLEAGVIRLDAAAPLEQRLCKIHQVLCELLDKYKPTSVAVEDIFFARYAQAALKLGHVRGVVLLAAAQNEVPLAEYPPATVKLAITGRGRADKDQVARMVAAMLGYKALPTSDATDALAVAITHALGAACGIAALAKTQIQSLKNPRKKQAVHANLHYSPVVKDS